MKEYRRTRKVTQSVP